MFSLTAWENLITSCVYTVSLMDFLMCQDESAVIWYHDKEEKQLELCHVSRIIPGQRTVSLSIPTTFFPYKGNFLP